MSYKIESNINFYSELYKSLDKEDADEDTDIGEKKCLITNQPLTEKYIKLYCGHTFNYLPLFNDIVAHKKKFNHMELSTKILSAKQLRCPYCRNVQNELLPYYADLGIKQVHGVNFYNPDIKPDNYLKIHYDHCSYLIENPTFNPELPESNTNKKHTNCPFWGSKITDGKYSKYNNDNKYSTNHKFVIKKKYNIESKQKIKDEKDKIKEELKKKIQDTKDNIKEMEKQLKENNKKAKEVEKQKVKEDKLKAKEVEKQLKENKLKAKEIQAQEIQAQVTKTKVIKTKVTKSKVIEEKENKVIEDIKEVVVDDLNDLQDNIITKAKVTKTKTKVTKVKVI